MENVKHFALRCDGLVREREVLMKRMAEVTAGFEERSCIVWIDLCFHGNPGSCDQTVTSPAWFLGWLVTPEQPQFEKGNMIRQVHCAMSVQIGITLHYFYISKCAPCLHVRATGLFSIWASQRKSRMNGQRLPGRALNDPNPLR